MFVSPQITNQTNGNIKSLGNVDYCKRYIIIEIPKIGFECQITIINISSSTGNDSIGIMSRNERLQTTNVYHCSGYVLKGTPTEDSKEISKLINADAMICINDISYGQHDFNLNRQRFNELRVSTSYSDAFTNSEKFSIIPNVRFYNRSHHVMNEDLVGREFMTGRSFIPKFKVGDSFGSTSVETVRLGDLIDNYTTVMVTRESNYDHLTNFLTKDIIVDRDQIFNHVDDYHINLNELSLMVVGPVTDLILGLLVNNVDFCYDSIDGMSRIGFKTEHTQSNSIYMQQIQTTTITSFIKSMEYITNSSAIDFQFRLFVKAFVGNVKLRVIKYEKHNGGYVSKDFEFDMGKFRNDQHYDSVHWANAFLF